MSKSNRQHQGEGTYFYQALAQVVGATPPEKYKTLTMKEYLSKDDEGLQEWALDEVTLSWSTGIGCIDAAMILVDEAIANANIDGDI
jgi:hypothetical protein